MKIVKYILIISASILGIIIVGGLLLPSQYEIERSIIIKGSIEYIENNIIDLRKWDEWSFMSSKKDTSLKMYYQQNNIGPYSSAKWKSKYMGEGIFRIYEYKPKAIINYEMIIKDNDHKINGTFIIDSTENGVRIKWLDYGELGYNPLERIFGLFMGNYLGQDQENSLKELKKIIEKND